MWGEFKPLNPQYPVIEMNNDHGLPVLLSMQDVRYVLIY